MCVRRCACAHKQERRGGRGSGGSGGGVARDAGAAPQRLTSTRQVPLVHQPEQVVKQAPKAEALVQVPAIVQPVSTCAQVGQPKGVLPLGPLRHLPAHHQPSISKLKTRTRFTSPHPNTPPTCPRSKPSKTLRVSTMPATSLHQKKGAEYTMPQPACRGPGEPHTHPPPPHTRTDKTNRTPSHLVVVVWMARGGVVKYLPGISVRDVCRHCAHHGP
jgi:hypothetical protein